MSQLPMMVDPKPYIRQILRVDLESITHPKARECLEFGLLDATTDEDFLSLIETFYLFSSEAIATIGLLSIVHPNNLV